MPLQAATRHARLPMRDDLGETHAQGRSPVATPCRVPAGSVLAPISEMRLCSRPPASATSFWLSPLVVRIARTIPPKDFTAANVALNR